MFDERKKSPLQIERAKYQPKMPSILSGSVKVKEIANTEAAADTDAIKKLFPKSFGKPVVELEPDDTKETIAMNVGVILSGGQAPGGHNVISGLFDGIKSIHADGKLYGFLGGPSGLIDHKYIELTSEIIDKFRNMGGFDIIGSGRTK